MTAQQEREAVALVRELAAQKEDAVGAHFTAEAIRAGTMDWYLKDKISANSIQSGAHRKDEA